MEETWWRNPEQLDDDQRAALALPADQDHLVLGPPGSGKTNLLLLRAAYIYKIRQVNIVVLTLGRVLREFLAAGTAHYPFAADKVQTYVRWAKSLLKENGIEFKEVDDFVETRSSLLTALNKLIEQGEYKKSYDCILIDEAQDFTKDEIIAIRSFSKRLYVVGDARQKIYDAESPLTYLEESLSSTIRLPSHYRNGLKICRVADGIRAKLNDPAGLEATSNYDETRFASSVAAQGPLRLADQVKAVVSAIETQLRAYPTGYIGILCPRHAELNLIWAEIARSSISGISQLQQYETGYQSFDPTRRVVVTTIHGAKGLEFRALHLLAMETVKKFPMQRNLSFTAVTRAKTSLVVYYDDTLPGYFEAGLMALESTAEQPPPLGDLFL